MKQTGVSANESEPIKDGCEVYYSMLRSLNRSIRVIIKLFHIKIFIYIIINHQENKVTVRM